MRTLSSIMILIVLFVSTAFEKDLKQNSKTMTKKIKTERVKKNSLPVNSFLTNNLEFFLNYTMFTDEKFNNLLQTTNKDNSTPGGVYHEKK